MIQEWLISGRAASAVARVLGNRHCITAALCKTVHVLSSLVSLGDGGGGHCLVRMEWCPAGWSVCLPLLIFPCTIKSRSSLLAPAHPGGAGQQKQWRLLYFANYQWHWHQLDHMQIICTSLQTDTGNHASTSSLQFFYWPDALPDAQPTVSVKAMSKHWKQCFDADISETELSVILLLQCGTVWHLKSLWFTGTRSDVTSRLVCSTNTSNCNTRLLASVLM